MVSCQPSKRSRRGQALVETALVLPILAVLMVMALDFGRVFFGWIALQNAARIGADFAATVPLAWDAPGEPQNRARYAQLVQDDLEGINCQLSDGGAIPDPIFEDGLDSGPIDTGVHDDGDYVSVTLNCQFDLITPLANNILGGPVVLAGHEEFPVNVRHVQGIPPPPPPPPECNPPNLEMPELTGLSMEDALDLWVDTGFAESNFFPAVDGPPPPRNDNKEVLTQSVDENECVLPTATVTLTHEP